MSLKVTDLFSPEERLDYRGNVEEPIWKSQLDTRNEGKGPSEGDGAISKKGR